MFTFRSLLGALMALAFTTIVSADDSGFREALRHERGRAPAPVFDRAAFLLRPSVTQVVLSPDGRRVAWLRGTEEARALWLAPTDGGEPRQLLANTEATALLWSTDSRWLLVASAERLFAVAVAGQAGSRTLTDLGGPAQREVMDVDPTTPGAVIVREQILDEQGRRVGSRLSRVRTDGIRAVLAEAPDRITGFALAKDGRLAYLQQVRDGGIVTFRLAAGGGRERVLDCEAMHRCALWPVVDRDGRPLFLGDIGGSLRRLQRLESDGTLHDLAGDPQQEADLDELVPDPVTRLPLLATYRGIRATSHGLDDATQSMIDRLQARYPGKALSFQPGTTRWLVTERGGALQDARYHLFDPAGGGFSDPVAAPPVDPRGRAVPSWLPESAMPRQLPFDWTASDGMRLHGFVRVPSGVDPGTVPLVAMVHGGPWGNVAANEFGTGVAAFLVNRGYAVFEPNFRGSTGYGRDYMLAANGDFGNGRVQRDVVEGVRALLREGVGDKERVGIVGASFGGYSTLLGLTWQPELFRVGVALVPPSDFAWDLTWIARTTEGNALSVLLPFERWMSQVRLDIADPERMSFLHRDSPLANAERMNRPLTIVAGGLDQRVALRGVLGYAARLRSLGKDVTLLVDPVAGHGDIRPLGREASLYLMADALHRHLGGTAESPPDAALRDYLVANLSLPGDVVTTVTSASPPASPKAGR